MLYPCTSAEDALRTRAHNSFRSIVLAVVAMWIGQAALAQTVTVDWNSEFPVSDVPFPADRTTGFVFNDAGTASVLTVNREFFVDGVSVGRETFPAGSGVTLPFTSDFVTYNDFAFGDAGVGNLPFVMDNAAQDTSDRIVVTLDFDRPVTDLAFNILDIDAAGGSNDAVEVFFNTGTGGDQNILALPAASRVQGTAVAISDIPGVSGYEGTAAAADTASGALQIDFAGQAVQSVRIEYFVGNNGTPDPAAIFIGLGDLSYTPTTLGQADLSLNVQGIATPTMGLNTFYDIVVNNSGADAATGITVDAPVPSGFTFQSDDRPGEFNELTGTWTIPGSIPAGGSERLRVFATVNSLSAQIIQAEVSASGVADPDSTPGNASTNPAEDDTDSFTVTPQASQPPLFCLGRPITPLVFGNPVAETPGANISSPQVNDVFRFIGAAPGIDVLVRVSALNGGATLSDIDDDGTPAAPVGVPNNFQPVLVGPAGDISADFEFTVVSTGTSLPGTLDFAGSMIDVDGNGAGLREYVEVSNNIVEFALNGVTPPTPATRLVTQANVPPDASASAPSAPDRVRFEAETDDTAAGIDPNEPRNIAAAFFTDVSVFEYRVGKFGGATAGRLHSLAFNCPNIDPGTNTGGSLADEDFGDAPFDIDPAVLPNYGNPIHVIEAGIQLGPTNTAESVPGDSPTANSDAGDDGVSLPASFQGLVPVTFDVDARGAGGFLQAFFDWNNDGDFDDAGEQPIVDLQDNDGNDGTPISVTVTPPVTTVGSVSFARFRWSTASGVGVQDPAGDGEVEDYQVTLLSPLPADLSLTIDASTSSLSIGDPVTLTVVLTNDGPGDATGVSASIPLPAGLAFVSSDGGAAYDPNTGLWTLPSTLATGTSVTLTIQASATALGTSIVDAEIASSDLPDPDSTPTNSGTNPSEDDTDSVSIAATSAPPVCPAGLSLVNTGGTASSVVSATSIGNPDRALGALSAIGTSPPDPEAAFVNLGASSVLVLDLGTVVPENAQLVFSLARDGGADNLELEIRHALVSTAFPNTNVLAIYGLGPAATIPSTVEDTLEHVTLTIPAGGLQFLRFDILNGDNGFVDGISFTQSCVAGGELEASKTAAVFDPASQGLFAVPGNDVLYTIRVENIGGGATDEDSIFLVDELPPEVIFFNGDADGPGPGADPVNFEDVVATGLDPFVFAESVAFAGAGPRPTSFADCTLTPGAGFDPAVRFVCFNPLGEMGSGTPNPEFALSFRTRIR